MNFHLCQAGMLFTLFNNEIRSSGDVPQRSLRMSASVRMGRSPSSTVMSINSNSLWSHWGGGPVASQPVIPLWHTGIEPTDTDEVVILDDQEIVVVAWVVSLYIEESNDLDAVAEVTGAHQLDSPWPVMYTGSVEYVVWLVFHLLWFRFCAICWRRTGFWVWLLDGCIIAAGRGIFCGDRLSEFSCVSCLGVCSWGTWVGRRRGPSGAPVIRVWLSAWGALHWADIWCFREIAVLGAILICLDTNGSIGHINCLAFLIGLGMQVPCVSGGVGKCGTSAFENFDDDWLLADADVNFNNSTLWWSLKRGALSVPFLSMKRCIFLLVMDAILWPCSIPQFLLNPYLSSVVVEGIFMYLLAKVCLDRQPACLNMMSIGMPSSSTQLDAAALPECTVKLSRPALDSMSFVHLVMDWGEADLGLSPTTMNNRPTVPLNPPVFFM